MAQIPPFFLNTVAAISRSENGSIFWIGTGFLYGAPVGDDNYRACLVTNKHVLYGLKTVNLRFNPEDGLPAVDFDLTLIDNDGKVLWEGHPSPEIDVAVISVNINFLKEQGMSCNFFEGDKHAWTIEQMKSEGCAEGDFVYALGFPMGLVSDRKYVIVRGGIISRITDLLEYRSKEFIIDAPVFPGNSGGPVIIKPDHNSIEGTNAIRSSRLIGIVKSYIPYMDTAVSQQTGRPRIIFEENSGLTLIEPVDHINETIAILHSKL